MRTPRDDTELTALERDRPEGWEYLLFAGALLVGRTKHEAAYHDCRRAVPTGEPVAAHVAMTRLEAAFPDLERLTSATADVLEPDMVESALGAPGQPGDAQLIRNLADGVVNSYQQIIEWSHTLRVSPVPPAFRRAYDLAADLANQPIEDTRRFIDRTVEAVDHLAAVLGGEDLGPIRIELELTLTADEALAERFLVELHQLQGMPRRKAVRQARRARRRFR